MNWSTILENALPTKASNLIAAGTIPAAIFVWRLPLYWPFSKVVSTETEVQMLGLLLSACTILLGALLCLVLMIHAYRALDAKMETLKIENQGFEEKNQELKIIAQKYERLNADRFDRPLNLGKSPI